MKRLLVILMLLPMLCGCASKKQHAQVVATTLPVYEFTSAMCDNTDITVSRLITQEISCLHDYTLQVSQCQALEKAELVVLSGSGLDRMVFDAVPGNTPICDSSNGITLHCPESDHNHHDHDHGSDGDPHIWLSIANARIMAENICKALCTRYPQNANIFEKNLTALICKFDALEAYGCKQLSGQYGSKIITFHDGFSYLAEDWGIEIVHAIEEESGSEASAHELIEIIEIIEAEKIPALFTEAYGNVSAAQIISSETGVPVYTLDMAMAGDSWFDAMYHNIDTLKEALE